MILIRLDEEFYEDNDDDEDDNQTLKGSSNSDEGSPKDKDYSISKTKGWRTGTNHGLMPAPKSKSSTGEGLKKNSKLIDFDFIPYDENNRIFSFASSKYIIYFYVCGHGHRQ